MIDEREGGKREGKGQEEIGGRVETENGRERHDEGAFLLVGPH